MDAAKKVTALVAALCGLLSAQAPQWHNLYPLYTGLTFGEDQFLTISSDGVMKFLGADGDVKRQRFVSPGGVARNLYSAAYGSGVFVVTQNNSYAMLSSDGGGSFSQILAESNCRFLTFGKGKFIGLSNTNRTFALTEIHGTGAWEWTGYQSVSSGGLFRAASDGEVFVAVGSNIVSSSDGHGWHDRFSGYSGNLDQVAYGGGKFVAFGALGGSVYTSENGSDWSAGASNVPARMADLTFGDGKFVAVGEAGAAAASADGINWTTSTISAADDFVAVRHGGGVFMALGANGSVYVSSDGVNWNSKADGRKMSYRRIICGGGKFVAVGDSGISVSNNGRDWKKGICASAGFKGLQSAAYGGGKFIAVGDSGAIFSSEDGETWIDNSRADNGIMLKDIAYGNDKFIIVGKSAAPSNGPAVLTRADGAQNFTDESGMMTNVWPLPAHPISISFNTAAGRFLAGGSEVGHFRSTADGRNWSNVTISPAAGYRCSLITYADNKFIALGTSPEGGNVILTSAEVNSGWTSVQAPPSQVKSITYAKGYYIAVGDSGKITASPNGQQWVTQYLATSRNLRTVCFDGEVLVAGGGSGALLYSDADPTMTVVSVRHLGARQAASGISGMRLETVGRTSVINLLFTPENAGTIEVYSLSGKRLYKKKVMAEERSVRLPNKAVSGVVIVRYSGGGRSVTQKLRIAR